MTLMTWNKGLSVNVHRFDDQHKQLVDYINELHDAMLNGKGNEALGNVLGKLADYTSNHFREEEQLMELHAYPDTLPHKLEHERLVKQVLDLQKKFADGEPILTLNIMMFLKSWLMNHIQISDKKYGSFFNSVGIE